MQLKVERCKPCMMQHTTLLFQLRSFPRLIHVYFKVFLFDTILHTHFRQALTKNDNVSAQAGFYCELV